MKQDFVNWLSANHKNIAIVWNGITTITTFFLGIIFPPEAVEINVPDGFYAEEAHDITNDLYELVSDGGDALDQEDDQEEEETEEEKASIGRMIDDDPDLVIDKGETESMIDEIEEIDEIHDEEIVESTEIIVEEDFAEEQNENTISVDEAVDLFESYYYSHGQNQELANEISAYQNMR